MALRPTKSILVDTPFVDRSKVFIEVTSPQWRSPLRVPLSEILDTHESHGRGFNIEHRIDNETIVLDPSTGKLKINIPPIEAPSVFSEPFNNHNELYNNPPINATEVTGVHMVTDENYLYIWVGNRWKRTPLSEWE